MKVGTLVEILQNTLEYLDDVNYDTEIKMQTKKIKMKGRIKNEVN
jgi:hypothetical protein